MKKCYNFLMALATIVLCLGVNFASAQNVIFSEDFSELTGSGSGNTQCEAANSDVTGDIGSTILEDWSGDKVYPANGKVKLGTGSVAGWLQTPLIDLTDYSSVRISFQAMVWKNNADSAKVTVYVGDETYVIENVPNTTEANCVPADFSIIVNGGRQVSIKFEGHKRFFLDNVMVLSADGPFLEVEGNTFFTDIPVNQEVSGNVTVKGYNLTADGTTTVAISGDSQFATTVTSLSNNDLMSENGAEVPFTFSAAAAGNYTATLSFTNSDLTEAVTVTLSANAVGFTEVPTIAALRALIDNSNVNVSVTDTSVFYKYTGHAILSQTFRPGNNYDTKWMQDSTGAIQLYDGGRYLENIAVDGEITNVLGQLCNYYGYTELKVSAALAPSDYTPFPETILEPLTITLGQLQDQTYMDGIQGQLIKLENVRFNEAGTFASKTYYTLTQGEVTDTAVYFIGSLDTQLGADIPTTACNIIGVNMRTAALRTPGSNQNDRLPSRYYILPREFEAVSGISENGKTPVAVYPNPTADNVTLTIGGEATTVSVYNVMGTLVSTQSVSYGANTLNMSNMPAGVYFLRITNGNEAVGTVKVVRQ